MKRKPTRPERAQDWQRRRDAGETPQQIADDDGVSVGYVYSLTRASKQTADDTTTSNGGASADALAAASPTGLPPLVPYEYDTEAVTTQIVVHVVGMAADEVDEDGNAAPVDLSEQSFDEVASYTCAAIDDVMAGFSDDIVRRAAEVQQQPAEQRTTKDIIDALALVVVDDVEDPQRGILEYEGQPISEIPRDEMGTAACEIVDSFMQGWYKDLTRQVLSTVG